MSRFFEALQRYHSEKPRTTFTWPQLKTLESGSWTDVDDAELGKCQTVSLNLSPESKLVVLTAKASLGAEKFRFLAVRLRQLNQVRSLKKVLITSTIPEEGKSLISANLTAALAYRHVQKILLLEGDLRRPVLAQLFGLGFSPGICEWLHGSGSIAKNVYHVQNAGFWLLPAGNAPDNPLELMQSELLPQILTELAARFDWIIIDSPPVLPLGDTSVWARAADGVLLVVREGKSQGGQLQSGIQALRLKTLLGIVLNSSSSADRSNYYHRYYSPQATSPPLPESAEE